MNRCIVLAAGLATLAACNKGPEINLKNASANEVAETVREAGGSGSFVEPGRWHTDVTLLDIDVPGMPPQMKEQMKRSMGKFQEHGFDTCISEADAKKPKENFFAGKNNQCRYDHFIMSGGTIDAAMKCTGRSSETMAMTINGSYSREAYDATMTMNMTGGPGGQGMTAKSHSVAHRVGACRGDEINADHANGK